MNSFNEWDPLEEVIVGRVDDAMVPSWDVIDVATLPNNSVEIFDQLIGTRGRPYSAELVQAAQTCLKNLIHILEAEGVKVRRPDPMNFAAPFSTPAWNVDNGLHAANPRDVFLVIGDEIIEAPMVDRGRYFETWPYRSLLKEYLRGGARWTAAPKPQLLDAQYDWAYRMPEDHEAMRYVITEFEPVFDAADFIRCGRDIFVQKSHVTNDLGITWLSRHLGETYRIHEIETTYRQAMHIDTSFMPLAPGKVLVNPEFVPIERLPEILRSWDILVCPQPVLTRKNSQGYVSKWGCVNVLMLDEKRILVEKAQEPLIKSLKDWGFEPIPLSFEDYYFFGGSFHCCTLDVRRKGGLQSYF
ncbi:MAG TPA: hypothetical protein VGD98_12310 [Ktedonobacteraceae bacterium]